MFRFLLSTASIFVLLVTTILLPTGVSARLCEERMPVTLLSLYRASEAVYVGKYEKTVDGEATEDTADYTVVPITKHFSVSSAMKGEPRKMLTLSDTEYRYKNQEATDEESEHGEGEAEIVAPGDAVLMFLKKNEDTGSLEPADFTDGIKKMTSEKLSAYEARIRELNGIFSSEKPKHSQIVEWLIRCAKDPQTRWEGTFELLQSFQNWDWQEERAKQAKEKPVEPKAAEQEATDSEEDQPEAPKEFDTGDPNFAKALTENQKATLTNILLNRERPKKSENADAEASVTYGDRELIELVKRWGDSRVAANLLEELRHDASDTNQNAELMASIASMLHDDELTSVSESYSNIRWESEEDPVRDESPVEPAESVEPASDSSDKPAAENAVDAARNQSEPAVKPQVAGADDSKESPKKKTYGEIRSDLLSKFLNRAARVIEKEQSRNSAKLRR